MNKSQHNYGIMEVDPELANKSSPFKARTPIPSQQRSSKWPESLSEAFKNAKYSCIGRHDGVTTMDVTTLQRLNLYHIQHELAKCAADMDMSVGSEEVDIRFSSDAMANLHTLLHRYCK
jgi:hypothetical protein